MTLIGWWRRRHAEAAEASELRQSFNDPLDKSFRPRPDITVAELAFIVGRIPLTAPDGSITTLDAGIWFRTVDWAELPENIKRHFE